MMFLYSVRNVLRREVITIGEYVLRSTYSEYSVPFHYVPRYLFYGANDQKQSKAW